MVTQSQSINNSIGWSSREPSSQGNSFETKYKTEIIFAAIILPETDISQGPLVNSDLKIHKLFT